MLETLQGRNQPMTLTQNLSSKWQPAPNNNTSNALSSTVKNSTTVGAFKQRHASVGAAIAHPSHMMSLKEQLRAIKMQAINGDNQSKDSLPPALNTRQHQRRKSEFVTETPRMGLTGYGTSGGFGVNVAQLDDASANQDDKSVASIRTPVLTERRQLMGGASYDQMSSF